MAGPVGPPGDKRKGERRGRRLGPGSKHSRDWSALTTVSLLERVVVVVANVAAQRVSSWPLHHQAGRQAAPRVDAGTTRSDSSTTIILESLATKPPRRLHHRLLPHLASSPIATPIQSPAWVARRLNAPAPPPPVGCTTAVRS